MTSAGLPSRTGWDTQGAPISLVHADALPASFAPGRPRSAATSPNPRIGVGAPVTRSIELLSGLVTTLDPARLTGPDAAELYRMCAAVERLTMAAKTLLAPRIDESGIWRDSGHRSPAAMLAELEGVPVGRARNTLEVGHRLPELPGTEEALRTGTLSGPKVAELSGAALLDPGTEGSLLAGAADQPLHTVKERCQRARSTAARHDPLAAARRIHALRHFSSWTDADGAFCFQGRDTADRGAKILQQMQHTVTRLRTANGTAPADGGASADSTQPDRDRALLADAFFLLLTGRAPLGVRPAAVDDDDPGPPEEHIAAQLDTGSGVPARPIRPPGAVPPVDPGPPHRELDRCLRLQTAPDRPSAPPTSPQTTTDRT